MDEKLMTLAEAADYLAIGYARAAEMARTGLLPVIRRGRQIRVSPERLAQFVADGGKPLPGGWRKIAR